MEVKKVIIRRPVSTTDKVTAMVIISNIDTERFTQLINTKSTTPDEVLFVAKTIATFDNAAKLLGFNGLNDMIEFAKIYGADAVM